MVQQKPFILIVEDDASLRKVLTRYLQAAGYIILEARNFQEAADQITIKPNLMILDINLPDATGWDVADWLASFTEPVPIVVMSGETQPSAQQLKKFKPQAFLAKPFDIETLLQLVQQYAPIQGPPSVSAR